MRIEILGSGDAFGSGGRFNTCLHLTTAAGASLLVDHGASSPLALARSSIDRAGIQALVFTHFHGDHFAGLPIFLLDAQYVTKRTAPLIIAGPAGIERRTHAMMEVSFPGTYANVRAFPISYVEIRPDAPATLFGVSITAFPVAHDEAAGPCQGYRFAEGGKVFAFSGDTAWCESLPPLARGADILLVECYSSGQRLPNHLDRETLLAQRARLETPRVVLTHMGPTMLKDPEPLPAGIERAADGMVLEP